MILPNVRASFGRQEAELLLSIAGPEGEDRLRQEGIDSLLDDPALVRQVLRGTRIQILPPALLFYLLARQALLERDLRDQEMADYTAAVLLEFSRADRREKATGPVYPDTIYLADILVEIDRAQGPRQFALRAHLGNVALWLAGVFPGFITNRVQRRGAPPISYYDEMGAAGFRSAASMELAKENGMEDLFLQVADQFSDVRSALNTLSDVLFFPRAGDPVERVLREVSDRFRQTT